MAFELLRKLPVKSFSGWFSELAAVAEKADDISSLPGLELLLRNGRVLAGVIVRLEETEHFQSIMVASVEGDQRVTFVAVHDVVTVSIPDPENFMKFFAPPVLSGQITNLEIKRRARETEQLVREVSLSDISVVLDESGINETGRPAIAVTLDLLREVFKDISSDELGKSAIQELVKTVVVSSAANPQVSLKDGKLMIAVGHELSRPLAQEKEVMLKEIQGLL